MAERDNASLLATGCAKEERREIWDGEFFVYFVLPSRWLEASLYRLQADLSRQNASGF